MFSTGDERDPVVGYKIYREKRPENMMADDAPFYLGINHIYTKTDSSKKYWFKSAPMGVNKINTDENNGFKSKHQQRATH